MRTAAKGFLLSLLVAPVAANGIVIRDTVDGLPGANEAVRFGSSFVSVVDWFGADNFLCSGFLIAPKVVLTAQHCLYVEANSQERGELPGYVHFHDAKNDGGFVAVSVAGFEERDAFNHTFDGTDLAVLFLAEIAPDWVKPLQFAAFSVLGKNIAMVGFGDHGTGSQGGTQGWDGIRRAADNVADYYGAGVDSNWTNKECDKFANNDNLYSADFDDGTEAGNTLAYCNESKKEPRRREGITAPGDSGGPLLTLHGNDWLVAGVLSGGTCWDRDPNTGKCGTSGKFQSNSWWTGTIKHRTWIEGFGGVFFVPEPGSLALLGLGLAGLGLSRRRRAH